MKYPILAVTALIASIGTGSSANPLAYGAIASSPSWAPAVTRFLQSSGAPRTISNAYSRGQSAYYTIRNSNRTEYRAPSRSRCGYVTQYRYGRVSYKRVCR